MVDDLAEPKDLWLLYGLYGLEIQGDEPSLQDPVWGDATVVSPGAIERALRTEDEKRNGLYSGKLVHAMGLVDDDVLDELGGDDFQKSKAKCNEREQLPVPHSYIAVRRAAPEGTAFRTGWKRAQDIAALLGLTCLRDCFGGIPTLAIHYDHEQRKFARIKQNGMLPDICEFVSPRRDTLPRDREPIQVTKQKLRTASEEGEPIIVPAPPADRIHEQLPDRKWHLDSNRPVVRSLVKQDGSEFDKRIKTIAHRLMETVHTRLPRARLVQFVTIFEMLVSHSRIDFDELESRAKCLLALPKTPFNARAPYELYASNLEDILARRHRIVHQGETAYEDEINIDPKLAQDLAVQLLFRVGTISVNSFHQFTKMLKEWAELVDSINDWDNWSEPRREALYALSPFRIAENEEAPDE